MSDCKICVLDSLRSRFAESQTRAKGPVFDKRDSEQNTVVARCWPVVGRAPKKRDNGRLQIGFEMLIFWRGRWGRLVAGGARGLAPTLVLATNIGKERDLELLALFCKPQLEPNPS